MINEGKWIASDGSELKPGMLVLAKNGSGIWFVSLFSHLVADSEKLYRCTNGMPFEHCIPLEGNEHMAGTTLPIPRKEKPFEWDEKVLVWCDGEDEKKPAIFICDLGDDEKYRYKVILKGTDRLTLWQYCTRAPFDADAEQR